MKRGSVWIPVVGTVCLLALSGTAWVSNSQVPVRERLARLVAEWEAQQAEPPRREALYGETLAGNACDDYDAASRVLQSLRLECCLVPNKAHFEWTLRGLPLTEDERRAIAPQLDVALQSIRRGVRRATLRLPERRCVPTFELLAIVDDAIDRAFAARSRDLAELYADRLVLTTDLWSVLHPTPTFRDEWLPALDVETAVWFDAALHRLDERTPIFASARDRIARGARDVADVTPLQQSFTMGLEAWRYGFDWYWRSLVFCDRLLANEGELEPPAHDWTKRQAQLNAFGSGIDTGANAWAAHIPAMLLGEERQRRMRVTELRVLRLALAFVHHLDMPQLDDPFGSGPIGIEIRGDEATFRSEGTIGRERLSRTARRR